MTHMGSQRGPLDEILAGLAAGTHGVVTRGEMNAAGIGNRAIQVRVRRGSLIPVHRGVYRVGHTAPSAESSFIAAVRACGAEALLSGRAAAHLHGLLRGDVPKPEVLTTAKSRPEGVTVTRTRAIDPADRDVIGSIPLTTIPRTLVDLAANLGDAALARACHEAVVRDAEMPSKVEAVLERRPGCPGAARLRRLLHGDDPVTLSRLERRFLRLVKHAALPLPDVNGRTGAHHVDCRWSAHRVTVELDGYRFHRSRQAWERDRERERAARERGDEHRRYTWADVVEDPDRTIADVRSLLARRAPG